MKPAGKLTIPTVITLFRLLAALVMLAVFQLVDRPLADWVAAALFAFGAVGDYLDGYLARRLNMESMLGQVLDPIADKVLIAAALVVVIAYSGPSLFAFVPFGGDCAQRGDLALACGPTAAAAGYIVVPSGLILFREFLVSGVRELLTGGTATLRVTRLAKWKSAAQMAALLVLLIAGALSPGNPVHGGAAAESMEAPAVAVPAAAGTAGIALLWIACLLTLATGADYLAKAVRIIRRG